MLSYQIETLCRIKNTDGQPPSRKHLDPTRGTQCSNVRKLPHSVVYYFRQSLKAPTATFRDVFSYTNEEDVFFSFGVMLTLAPLSLRCCLPQV